MQDKVITSLCYVDSKNDKTARLCRIADYENGRFNPYSYHPDQDFFGEERDLLYGQNYEVLAEQGEIAVFDWYSFLNSDNQWRTKVKRNNSIAWCEVLTKMQYDSPYAIIERMKKEGITVASNYDGKRDLVIVTMIDLTGSNAVYLKKENVKLQNTKLYLADNVTKLPVGTVEVTRATDCCQCRYLKTDQRYLHSLEGFKEKKQKNVKQPIEIVRDIIQGNVGYFESEVLSRREKQMLKGIIARVTEPTIVDLVCSKMDCTVQEANEYINQYIDAAKLKMDKETALSVIQKLVESDVDAVLEMKKVVKEEWLTENEALITEKKKEIAQYNEMLKTTEEEAKKERTRVHQGIQTEEGKLKKLKAQNDELTESIESLKGLKTDLEQEIQERLANAKNNLAGSMLDQALLSPVVPQQAVSVTKTFTVHYQEMETEKASIYDCNDVAVVDWKRVCGDEDMSAGLALIALATFACNRSILVAGEGAETIADMLCVSACGHKPLKLHIRDDADLDELISEVEVREHKVVCVLNGLESGYTAGRELMEHFRDSRFIFTAMHWESLTMEPESLFSAFFPILTDYFYNGRHVQELSTLDCSEELLKLEDSENEKKAFKAAKRSVGKWLKNDFFPPILKVRCAKLIASMKMLADELDLSDSVLHTAEVELVLTPWLKCLRKSELIYEILEEDTLLDTDKKRDLTNYVGMGGT